MQKIKVYMAYNVLQHNWKWLLNKNCRGIILPRYYDFKISNELILLRDSQYFATIIIYHDFLPTPRRGSHVKSDNTHTHTVIKKHPLAHILDS